MCREAFKKFKACIKVPDINTHRSNPEKDRVTIEHTCEALPKLVQEIDGEEHRAVREGLDEESLAILYLLREPDLKASDGQLVFDANATHAPSTPTRMVRAVARMALRIAVSASGMGATPCSCCPVAPNPLLS